MNTIFKNPIRIISHNQNLYLNQKFQKAEESSLDQKKYNDWIQGFSSRRIGSLVKTGLPIHYVSYASYTKSLNTLMSSAGKDSSKNTFIVSLVEPGKSQAWVNEIALRSGFKADAYIQMGGDSANELEFSFASIKKSDIQKLKEKEVVILILDDGSFSGNQMAHNITAANKVLRELGLSNYRFEIKVPYCTSTAIKKIKDALAHTGTKGSSFSYCHKMETIDEQIQKLACKKKEKESIKSLLWPHVDEATRQKNAIQSALFYFAHKVPNSMSFPEVIAQGYDEKGNSHKFIPDITSPYKHLS